jgi:hypothetical protein
MPTHLSLEQHLEALGRSGAALAEAAAASLLDWYAEGLAALVDTVRAAAEDAEAMG